MHMTFVMESRITPPAWRRQNSEKCSASPFPIPILRLSRKPFSMMPSPLPEQPEQRLLNSYSSQEKDHGGREKGKPHPMKGIPLSEFPLCTFRESIRIHSDHTVVDWYQGQ